MATATQYAGAVEDALARVWTEIHREFGPDESAWAPWQHREYDLRLAAVHYDPQVVA
ncbi:hypothetical protein OG601_46935 [Streptomyces sp. NBC_01239]|uniref:hypothetical protein n=1 Tax=Streptomyces sp. NBC_01239 TaxID=2903792 RepID=UPI00224CE7E8|nr:hypothetical protein [Streptomyces sp. NBC_01239]MCX4809073.1 hypothetical protein [Streptomyces sp. NBC_01239]MCX4818110.1 hypothetical protein [Streptomyces sp. NBC_01239]